MEIPAAFHAIDETHGRGDDWNLILKHAPEAIFNAKFKPYTADELRWSMSREFRGLSDEENFFPPSEVLCMLNFFVAANRYYFITGTQADAFALIYTPDVKQFDQNRTTLIFVIEMYRRFGPNLSDQHNIPGMSISIETTSQRYTIKVHQQDSKAYCGLEFRR